MKSKRQVPFSQHSLIKSKKTKIIFGQHQIIVNNEADIAISDSNGNDELFSFEILFDHYEKQEPLHQKFNQEVISGTQLWKTQKSLIESVNSIASFRRDVKITNCDEKEDSLEDVTPFGQVHTKVIRMPTHLTEKELNKFLDSGLSITLFNLDKYFECVREFVRYFDQKWKGEGGCYSSFHVTPRGKMPFPPFVDGDDKIIFQLQGSQNVKLFPPVNYDVQTELETFLYYEFPTSQPTIVHALLPFLQAKPILDIQLSPGDYLYVPKDYVLMTKASKQGSSFDVVIHLSKLKSTADLLKILTNKCSQKVYPHQQNNPFGKVVHETTQILQRGLDELPRIEKILQQRISLTRQDFNVFSSLDSYNLEELLEQNGGFVRLPNFLPIEVADKIHQTLVNMFDDEWVATESKADLSSNNIAHKFYSSKSFPNSDAIFNIFRHLIPFKESTFSAAKYSTSHHIDPHDDRAYKEIAGNIYSRYVAVIYYLTKDWKPEDGGGLVDVENNRQVYVPQYNSVVAFKVPRWHQVLPVLATDKQRLSIFGWFLVPGKLYKLNTGKHGAQY